MNYVFRAGIIEFASGRMTGGRLSNLLGRVCARLPPTAILCEYNFLGSHDTPRVMSILKERRRAELAYALLFSLPGAPAIYYGDEFLLKGDNAVSARRTIDWSQKPPIAGLFHDLSLTRREHGALVRVNAIFRGTADWFSVIRADRGKRPAFECTRQPLSRRLVQGRPFSFQVRPRGGGGRSTSLNTGGAFHCSTATRGPVRVAGLMSARRH